jgi:thiamine-phosphate diphosphorylase
VIPRLHVVTNDRVLASPGFLDAARGVIRAGGESLVLHIRAHSTPVRQVLQVAEQLHSLCSEMGGRLSVNDRLDVALAVGTGWVHLRAGSVPAREARRLMGRGAVIGASVHSAQDAESATDDLDYIFAGNVFETQSHPARPGRGLGFIETVCGGSTVAVVAIGGITLERVREVARAGAAGVAVISGVWSSGDPGEAVTRYLEALTRYGRGDLLPIARANSEDE